MSDDKHDPSFADLVGKVRPLRPDNTVTLQRPRPPARPRRRDPESTETAQTLTPAVLHDDEQPAVADGSYQRNGVQRSVLRKLRRGQYPVAAEIDLHGLNLREAGVRLARFLEEARGRRFGCVRVIHGKGLSSPGLKAVLKPQVLRWLRGHDSVLAYTPARDADGGSGALYVLLRSRGD